MAKMIKGFEISGLKEAYKEMGLLEEEILKIARKEMNILGDNIAGEAKKLVPIDTGTLARSIICTNGNIANSQDVYEQAKNKEKPTPQVSEKNPDICVISANTPYARRQHEDMTLDHSLSRLNHQQGEAKYLERPFNERADKLEENIREELRKKFQK